MEEKSSRTYLLKPEVKARLYSTFIASQNLAEGELREILPPNLTLQEIEDIEYQISNYAELDRPSQDAFSYGRRAAAHILLEIGVASGLENDFITADNILARLKKRSLGTTNSMSAYLALWPKIRQWKRETGSAD